MKKYTSVLVLLAMAVLCASCVTKRDVASRDSTEELSRRLGVKITSKDNIRLYKVASQWIGVPYRYGGKTKNGVDCSGFAGIFYREVYGKDIAAPSDAMLKNHCKRIDRSALREGDLVFFRTGGGSKKTANHVGVYLKNDKFVHASTSSGVRISALSEPYYQRAWITGGRVK
jgi:lipoprotein Spr